MGHGTAGWINVGNGKRVETMVLIQTLRKYRGRLGISELIAIIGGDKNNKSVWGNVWRLCKEYSVLVRIAKHEREGTRTPRRNAPVRELHTAGEYTAAMIAARLETQRQIAMAHDEARWAPPYNPGEIDY